MDNRSPSELASSTGWQTYAWNPASFIDLAENLERAAFFGFRPAALLPAVIPPQLVAPEFAPILQAAAQADRPPPDLCPLQHGPLVKAVQRAGFTRTRKSCSWPSWIGTTVSWGWA